MKIIGTAGYALLLVAVLAALVSSVNGECTACQGGSSTAQQDVLNSKWAAFMGDGNATTTEVITSSDGLISPQYSRARLQAEDNGKASEETNLNKGPGPDSSPSQAPLGVVASNSKPEPERSQKLASVLVPLESANNSGIILDISPKSAEYIPGAINIPYTKFLDPDGVLLPVSEMARILGEAGVSQSDYVLIYGECQPCGGGPSAAAYVYWVMKYLGHENVKLLDGGIDDWVAAGQPTVTEPAVLSPKSYDPTIKADLLATYEYVHSNVPLIVDARTPAEFGAGSIPNAVNIPYEGVLDGKRIKDEEALQKLFSSLQKDKPIVVYTNTGVKASMTWLALMLLGYDARIYSWQDWQANKPQLNIELQEARAEPNPAQIGDVVQMTVVFKEMNQSTNGTTEQSKVSNETVLTIKGCATCGFGSPQGYADLSSTGGVVTIGSSSQAQKNAASKGFTVLAMVKSSTGDPVSKVILKRISGDEFAGIWNANVAAGVYKVDIVASLDSLNKTFPDAMEIEVV
jgi:thiosulfate/3-mercaptopyruvate sulfurtransferase